MKPTNLILIVFAFITMSFHNAGSLTEAERKYAADLLQETQDNLLKKLNGLTAEQLNFKPDSSTWSIAECVEHIAITESGLFSISQEALKVPADPSKRSEVKMTDDAVVKMITDRSSKAKASEAVSPSGRFGSYEAALDEFKTQRASHIKYIESTSDDLRNHYYDFPFGKFDAYQSILFMAGHSKRHTDQIEEVMKHANFPGRKG